VKAFLLHAEADFAFDRPLPANHEELTQDLELRTLWSAMADGDQFLFEVARRALLQGLTDTDEVCYRQQALGDCVENPEIVRDLYALACEALGAEKTVWGGLNRDSPKAMLGTWVKKMQVLVDALVRLEAIAGAGATRFRSPAFTRLFTMIRSELDESYFEQVREALDALAFKGGVLISARLAAGNKGAGYTLRRPLQQRLLGRIFERSGYSFTVPERDLNGFRALGDLEDRGTNVVADALGQAVDDVKSFFTMLRIELGFYVGALNLRDRLTARGACTCLPRMRPSAELAMSATDLYDVCLALTIGEGQAVGNDLTGDGRSLVVITGANQGGKSTLLRGIGIAQLMGQAGIFTGAGSLRLSVCNRVFTHYKREEDRALESGKLDEELARMSAIADEIGPGAMLLCNESFASTNEREGSEIARQVIAAMLDERIRVLIVTHMFELSDGLRRDRAGGSLFLRAERGADGARPYKLVEHPPLATSYGLDSYRAVFGSEPGAGAPQASEAARQ
jgi:MutS domain V